MTVAPRAIGHRVRGVLRGPQAKAVVVLGSENQPAHATELSCFNDVGGTESARVEDVRGFVAKPPLPIGEGVDREV